MPKKPESLAPVGETMPGALSRLHEIPEGDPRRLTDAEWIMARLWERANIPDPSLNFGVVPLDAISHICSEECGKQPALSGGKGHHYTRPPKPEYVKVAAAVVQWLATNVGRSFYEEFTRAFKQANSSPTA